LPMDRQGYTCVMQSAPSRKPRPAWIDGDGRWLLPCVNVRREIALWERPAKMGAPVVPPKDEAIACATRHESRAKGNIVDPFMVLEIIDTDGLRWYVQRGIGHGRTNETAD
jgi:hypothetical protein